MNLPNMLTLLRIAFTIVFVFFLCQTGLDAKVAAFVLFTLASLTDFLDGYIARKYNLISNFGKIMDPIADKFLMLSAFFVFTRMELITVWMFAIIFVREVLVTVLRLFAMAKGITLAAEQAGKVKTVLQIVVVYLIIIFIILAEMNVEAAWYPPLMMRLNMAVEIFMLSVVVMTVWSGFSFVWNNRRGIFCVR